MPLFQIKDLYRSIQLGGYSVAMPAELSETLFSPTTLLWLVVVGVSVALLFGSMNRRRTRLTQSLRDYVDHSQDGATKRRDERPDD